MLSPIIPSQDFCENCFSSQMYFEEAWEGKLGYGEIWYWTKRYNLKSD